MVKSKLIVILKTFTNEELKSFRMFVHSPFHNTNKKVIKLFDLIRKYSPDFNNEKLRKENLYKKLYKDKPYNDIVMRILISDLMKLAEDFIVHRTIQKNETESRKLLLNYYLEREAGNLFEKTFKETTEIADKSLIDDMYFKNKFDIEELGKGYNIIRDKQQLNSENLVTMGEAILNYFIIKMSDIIHDIRVNEGNFNIDIDKEIRDCLIDSLNPDILFKLAKNTSMQNAGIFEMYLCLFMLEAKGGPEKLYFRSRELLQKNYEKISHEAKYNIYQSLLSYCGNRNWTDKRDTYMAEQLSIYKEMADKGMYGYRKNSYMTIIMFRDILITSTSCKDFDWQKYFIENYIDKLAPEQRDNMFNYSMAKLSFAQKCYEESLNYLNKVKYNLFTFKFDVKSLMLQNYYELNYLEESRSVVDSFKHFISKNKSVSENFRQWNLNFIKFYQSLYDIRSGKNGKSIKSLKKDIEDTAGIASKNWLLNKVKELEGNL